MAVRVLRHLGCPADNSNTGEGNLVRSCEVHYSGFFKAVVQLKLIIQEIIAI